MNPMRTLLLLGLLASAGCGGGAPEEPQTFIALERDFQGFTSWERFHREADGSGGIHTGVDRDIYLKSRPSKGAKEFPVGTLIVKHTDGVGDPDNQGPRTFGMVKRGGDFNISGAKNWEWFELVQSNSEDPTSPWQIVWRGLGPPIGSGYGAGGSECNSCHSEAAANDYVEAEPLQLSTLTK
jgi:hypothetical protein